MFSPNLNSSIEFMARITCSEPACLFGVETWVHDFDPTEEGYQPAGEWVAEHFSEANLPDLLKHLGFTEEEIERSWQILCTGKLKSYYIPLTNEWDEIAEYESVQKVEIDPDTHPAILALIYDPSHPEDNP